MARRVFFYDDRDVAARQNMHLAYGPVTKHGVADMARRDCDLGRASVFCGSVVPMPGGGYRLYYSALTEERPTMMRLAYAESDDGLKWRKPDLGQIEWNGEGTNWLHVAGLDAAWNVAQPQVCLLPGGAWRMWFWWHGQEMGRMPYVAAESDDGIVWRAIDLEMPHLMHPADRELGQNALVMGLTEASGEDTFADQRTMDWVDAKRLRTNDASFVYYNEDTGKFEFYSVWLVPVDEETGRMTPHDNASGVLRTIQRRESADGIVWSDPEMLILADEHDPMHQQFYHLAVHREHGWHVGMLGHYRCWEQTMDLELCFSRDGHAWNRPLRGGWIPRGGSGDIDSMYVYPTNRFIDAGDEWLLLYNGGNCKHNRELPEGVEQWEHDVMVATAPKGRFAGLQADERCVGSFTLKRFNQSAQCITVDADIRGRLQAELRDPFDRPIAGYELNACEIVRGDSARHELKWHGQSSAAFQYEVVSLRVEVEDGIVYSVEV